LTVYLDASVVVSLFVEDVNTAAARRVVQSPGPFVVSAWTLAECSSAFSRLCRMGQLEASVREQLEDGLDDWMAVSTRLTAVIPDDLVVARTSVRNSRRALRAPDALHLAIASRQGYALATFDGGLAAAARDMSLAVIDD
jgi:predicted nucleic acid-binding protein